MTRLFVALSALVALLSLAGCIPVVATGMGAGVLMADDRRTSGIYIEDERIEVRALVEINKLGDRVHVNTTSFNRIVLLTGEVPDEASRAKVESIVAGIDNVRRVQNELVVAPPSSLGDRSNDVYLTSRVKTAFLGEKKFSANHVKVVTEASVVYLLGLVKADEGTAAGEIAAAVPGVKRVVKVFETFE